MLSDLPQRVPKASRQLTSLKSLPSFDDEAAVLAGLGGFHFHQDAEGLAEESVGWGFGQERPRQVEAYQSHLMS